MCKFSVVIIITLSAGFVSTSYESPHVIGAPPILPGGAGQSAGSYYHYHVPLVSQDGGGAHHSAAQYQGHYMSGGWDSHSVLLWLIPLLLLLLLAPLALAPLLLKALLIPAGLSLLALLLPLLMMGGMMMMMMMGGGMMMMPMRNQPTAVTTARNIGQVLLQDGPAILESTYSAIKDENCGQDLRCSLRGVMKAIDEFKKKLRVKTSPSPVVATPSPGISSTSTKDLRDDQLRVTNSGNWTSGKEKKLKLRFKAPAETI